MWIFSFHKCICEYLHWFEEEWELGVVVREQGSQLKGHGFETRLFQILIGNGVKAMPGSIPVNTQSCYRENREM